MLHSYKSYILILESKAREKKIKKVKDKIKKFVNIPAIIEWSIEKCTSSISTEGIQYAVWIANHLKYIIVNGVMDTTDDDKISRERVEKLMMNGIGSDDYLEKDIKKEWSDGIESVVQSFIEVIDEDINFILDWLKNPLRDEKVNLGNLKFEEAKRKSEEWHNSLKATGKITDESGKIFIEFDDGFYWIDLQTTSSQDEATAMGHCGNTNDGDTLFSLRDKNKSPHVTVAYDSKDHAIYQMKGRGNEKPVEKYHPYIYRLLVDPELKPQYFAYEYLKEEDFNMSDFDEETFKKVYNYNPNLVYKSISYDHSMCIGLLKKGYLEKSDIKNVLLESKEVTTEVFFELLMGYDKNGIELNLFSNEELKEFYNILEESKEWKKDWGELPWILLYNRNIINTKQLSEYFSNIIIEDDKSYLDGDEYDLQPFMSEFVKKIYFGNPFEDWEPNWFTMDNTATVWDDLTRKTKEQVIKHLIGTEINYNHWQDEENSYFENVTITKDMIKWDKIGGEYYFVYNNNNYEIDKIIDENKDDELLSLFEELNRALNYSKKTADQDAYYGKCDKAVEEVFGPFTRKTKENGKVLRFTLDIVDFDDVETSLIERYSNGPMGEQDLDYEQEDYGSLWKLMEEYKDIVDIDDNDVYGTIDKNDLNEQVLNTLSNI